MRELSEIVQAAIPIIITSHAAATIASAYARHKATQDFYSDKTAIERMPRCVYKRFAKPDTFKYTALLSTLALAAYYIIKNA